METIIQNIDNADNSMTKIKELRQIVGTATKDLIDLLKIMIENDVKEVKIEAIKVLGDLEYDLYLDDVLDFLEDIIKNYDIDEVREYALRSYEFIGLHKNLDFIYNIASNKKESNILRWYAFATLSENYDKEKLTILENELKLLKY